MSSPTLNVHYQGALRSIPRDALYAFCVLSFASTDDVLAEHNSAKLLVVTKELTAEMSPSGLYRVTISQRDPFSGELTKQDYAFMKYNPSTGRRELNIRRMEFAAATPTTTEEEIARLLTEAGRRLIGYPNRPPSC